MPKELQECSRCHDWDDCWIAPNDKTLCDDCKTEFGLEFCNTCNELAPLVSFAWLSQDRVCYDCLSKEVAKLTLTHTRYLKDNQDVAAYLTQKEHAS